MVRKSLMAGGAIVLLMGLLFGSDAFSYVRTGCSRARAAVKDAVPLEFEIGRAERMIKDLDPEIRRNMHIIAKEEVEVADLRKNVDELEVRLGKSEKEVLRLTNDLKRGDSSFVYAGKSYSSEQVKTDLESRFNRHKSMKATSEKLTQIVNMREKGLAAAQEKLRAMQSAKGQLEVDVANLKARLELVQVAQASSNCQFDDSVLSRAKGLVSDISTRIDVAEKLVNADTSSVGEIDLEEKTSRDITQEVTNFFGGKSEATIVKLD